MQMPPKPTFSKRLIDQDVHGDRRSSSVIHALYYTLDDCITVAISKMLRTLHYIQPMTKRLTLPTAHMTEATSSKVIFNRDLHTIDH